MQVVSVSRGAIGGVRPRRYAKLIFGQTLSTNASSDYLTLRQQRAEDIAALPEHRASLALASFLREKCKADITTHYSVVPPTPPPNGYRFVLDSTQIQLTLDAMLATFCLHIESRIAAMLGQGFYTIGPCGEEALSSAAWALSNTQDSLALHYRHLGINLARQLSHRQDGYQPLTSSIDDLLLDRARGYTVSRFDPVTGGVHCSIGSSPDPDSIGGDFLVTSTLASQCSPAVGRALGYSLVLDKDSVSRPVSFVTVGDGSVHNHHFWSAYHLARHARHKRIKCPVVFGISDNGLSISYSTDGYVDTLFGDDSLVRLYQANGNDMMDVYDKTRQAVEYSRKQSAPSVIHYKGLIRRFGHAATDRQDAYLDQEQIESMVDMDVLESAIVQAVEVYGATSYAQVRDRLEELLDNVQSAFVQAALEEKVGRNDMMERVSAPLVPVSGLPIEKRDASHAIVGSSNGKREVMRKLMNRVIGEAIASDDSVVYLGEDVRHGGYYVVTQGLDSKYPGRIFDFPPDETSLLGTALGFSQLGLTPIVEIPYSKYLDCGADMYYEIAIMHWLSAGKRPNGMIIRLQGFDRGLFGGSFHTSNMLQHVPPGIDLVCFSNGEDYVRGFRHAMIQAKAGHIVVLVDCTGLLNLRHLHEKDRGWERSYPEAGDDSLLAFDNIRTYGSKGTWAMLSFGNGVVTALKARRDLTNAGFIPSEEEVDVIDCPLLSRVPSELPSLLEQYDGVIFLDICKEGPGSSVLAPMACALHNDGQLPKFWRVVSAPRTYNPLGSMSTFLNVEDVFDASKKFIDELKNS